MDIERNNLFYGDFFGTGDIGSINKEGYVIFSVRSKELLNVGCIIFTQIEVDDKIKKLDSELEAVCIGIPDSNDVLGEVVKAFIVKGNSSFNFEDIDEFLKLNLEKYKVPVEYEWIKEIPKTLSGKIQRQNLN